MRQGVRAEISPRNPYHLSKHRYLELQHFCRQAPEWEAALRVIDGYYSHPFGNISGKIVGNPTEKAMEKRSFYADRTDRLEQALRLVCPDLTAYRYLKEGVVQGLPFETLQARRGIAPFSRDAYYQMYRKFFWHLDKLCQ